MFINKSILFGFLVFSVLFLFIDFIWISIASKIIYKPNLPGLLLDKPILWAAIIFYLLYSVGVTLVILKPAIEYGSVLSAFWTGLIFGLVAYGTWSLTNMAILKGWSPFITFIDILWGGLITSSVSSITIYIINKFI